MRRLPEEVATSRLVTADLRFHLALVDRVASPRLSRLYGTIAGELHLTMIQTRQALGRVRIAAEHGEVLARLRAGDGRESSARCASTCSVPARRSSRRCRRREMTPPRGRLQP